MRWKDTCDLLSKKTESIDNQGNLTYVPESKTVYCNIKSVKYNEYFQAAATGLKAELVIVMRDVDYDGQELIKYNDITYKVIRTFVKGDNIEITLSKEGVV